MHVQVLRIATPAIPVAVLEFAILIVIWNDGLPCVFFDQLGDLDDVGTVVLD